MAAYLLDTNHIQPLWQKNAALCAKMDQLKPPVMVHVCTVTLGELEAGHSVTDSTDKATRDSFTAWINEVILPNAIGISVNTRLYYARIMEGIFRKNPTSAKVRTDRRLVDLGVDINDVWTVAVAWERGLTFCTTDNMHCIREAAMGHVNFDCWL